MTIVIREAVVEDVPAIAAIASSSPTAPQWPQELYVQIAQPEWETPLRRRLFVAVMEGSVVGFAAASILQAVLPPEAELETLAVAPGARGQGAGEALVRAVIAWARGAHPLRLEVRSASAGAIRLYLRCGFVPVAVRRQYYGDPTDDAVCMELSEDAAGR